MSRPNNGYFIALDADTCCIEIHRNELPVTTIKFNKVDEMFNSVDSIVEKIDLLEPGRVYTSDEIAEFIKRKKDYYMGGWYDMVIPEGMPTVDPSLGPPCSRFSVSIKDTIDKQNNFEEYKAFTTTDVGKKLAEFDIAKAKLIRGIYSDMNIKAQWPNTINVCCRTLDRNIVVCRDDPARYVADYFNSVPLTNYQDYLNIMALFEDVQNKTNRVLTHEDAATLIANYICDRDDNIMTTLKYYGILNDKTLKKLPSFGCDSIPERALIESKLPNKQHNDDYADHIIVNDITKDEDFI